MSEPNVTPERAILLAPYAEDLRRSELRRLARAIQPRSLTGYVRWIRHSYRQEPPLRIHARDLAPDGTPRWSGDFAAWVSGSMLSACGQDDDGHYRTPLRCALFMLHGRDETAAAAAMADFAFDIAATDHVLADIAPGHGIGPAWVVPIVAEAVLRRVWELFTPVPK